MRTGQGNKDTLKHRLQEGRRRKGASNNKPGKQAAAPAEQEATMADKEHTGRSSSSSSSSAATTATATATTKVPTGTVKRKRYDYYCVIDFEATCELGKSFQYDNEIIEFPAVLLDGTTMAEVDAEFHAYVKPVLNPTLTAFCTELTGITQQKVDASDTFPVVLERFEAWMAEHGLWPESPTSKSVAFITDGPWDFRDFVHKQCGISDIKRPAYFNKWINLRHVRPRFNTRYFIIIVMTAVQAPLWTKRQDQPRQHADQVGPCV